MKTNSKIYMFKTYNKIINNFIYRIKQYKAINKKF